MINAKDELLSELSRVNFCIKCAEIWTEHYDREDATCIEGFLRSTPLEVFKDKYKTSIKDARYNYLKLKNDLNKLGGDIVKI